MRTGSVLCVLCGVLVGSCLPGLGTTIVVDCNGGGDYLTVQEGVDAAAYGDTVIVWPCVYADTHITEIGYLEVSLNVHVQECITLISSDGPDVTIIDGGGLTDYGIVGETANLTPLVVEGFTVRNGGEGPWGPSIGIVVRGATARGNVCTGYGYGFASYYWIGLTGIPDRSPPDRGPTVIADNTSSGNECGISADRGTVSGNTAETNDVGVQVVTSSSYTPQVEGNTVTANETGIRVSGPGHNQTGNASLVDNVVSENTRGVYVSCSGGSYQQSTLYVTMTGNQVFDSAEVNLRIGVGGTETQNSLYLLAGGSLADANDFYGSPLNLQATQSMYNDGEVSIVATHNYWGSTFCGEFVPLFLLSGVPDEDFVFLPFTDEAHSVEYPDCETAVPERMSWGRLKALYE